MGEHDQRGGAETGADGDTEIWQSWRRACAENAGHPRAAELFDRHTLPAFHDPFAGGGSLPLEAQRLGLEAHATDLNPVAVLINKAMIEIPPKFAGRSPVNPEARNEQTVVAKTWYEAQGLAEDVRHYGQWMRDEAEKRIGHLYPPVEVTSALVRERPDLKPYEGRKLTVIAWLWARTVKSPNPAFADVDVPLASTFMLSTKKSKEAYVEPVIEGRGYRFEVKVGAASDAATAKRGTKSGGSGSPFLSLISGSPMPFDYLRAEAKAGRMGSRLMAGVATGTRGRVYLTPTAAQDLLATQASPDWMPDTDLPTRALGFRVQEYGMLKWRDLFTPRQIVAVTTISDLVGEATERVRRNAAAAALPDNGRPLRDGGRGRRRTPSRWRCICRSRRARAAIGTSACACGNIAWTDWSRHSADRRCPWYGTMQRPIHLPVPVATSSEVWSPFVKLLKNSSTRLTQVSLPSRMRSTRTAQAEGLLFPPIRRTTTTSAMQTCRISSTSGCAAL